MLQISWRMEAEKGIAFHYLANGLTRTASNPPPEQIAAMLKAEPPDKWSLLINAVSSPILDVHRRSGSSALAGPMASITRSDATEIAFSARIAAPFSSTEKPS